MNVGDKETGSGQAVTNESRDPRRKLLKKLAAGGVVGAALPAVWSRPVIDSVLLPAHAQTTGAGAIVGGGGGGGTGPGPAPSRSTGGDLIDFFINPAQAGEGSELDSYCVEIRVGFAAGEVNEVVVTRYCILAESMECAEGTFYNVTEGSVKLKKSGDKWRGIVGEPEMVISNINLGPGNKLADIVWLDGIPGTLRKGESCNCSCEPKGEMIELPPPQIDN
jgi:hypothetical protein